MERNTHTQSDHSVLDAPRIRTIALDMGYSSVNLYDQVDSTTTRARELLMDGTDPEREQLGELWCARTPPPTRFLANYPKTATTG